MVPIAKEKIKDFSDPFSLKRKKVGLSHPSFLSSFSLSSLLRKLEPTSERIQKPATNPTAALFLLSSKLNCDHISANHYCHRGNTRTCGGNPLVI